METTQQQSATPRFCGNCGCELLSGAKFCKKCGSPVHQTDNYSQNNYYDGNQVLNKKKPLFSRIFNIFEFKNIGKKYKTIAKVFSIIYIVLFSLLALVLIIDSIGLLFVGSITFFIVGLLLIPLFLLLLFLLLVLIHIPLWKLYAFGEIYESICKK